MFIIASCLVIVVLVIYSAWRAAEAARNFDGETLCRKDLPLKGHTVVLVDKSDFMAKEEIAALAARIQLIKRSGELARNSLLTVLVVNGDTAGMLTPSFRLCNPGTKDDANALFQNPLFVQADFDDKFGRPLDDALKALMEPETTRTSPILEAIKHIADGSDFNKVQGPRRLIIFSDMLQNVPEYSHYGNVARYEAFKGTPYQETVAARLEGVDVEIHYLDRPRDRLHQNAGHRKFWQDYFTDAGASSVKFLTSKYEQRGTAKVTREKRRAVPQPESQ